MLDQDVFYQNLSNGIPCDYFKDGILTINKLVGI